MVKLIKILSVVRRHLLQLAMALRDDHEGEHCVISRIDI